MERVILHSDLNNFYASVECLYNPAIRHKPVAVAGDPEQRHGIVLAKNSLAKRYGVQTGDPLWLARRKCGNLVFVPPHYGLYLRYSQLAQAIYSDYTDLVESFGLDECWLDITGSTHLFGDGMAVATALRRRIRAELGVTASVGVSFNKVFAKLGSDLRKPDATTEITPHNFRQKVWPLPVEELLYVGPATARRLSACGIGTIGALANADPRFLMQQLGKVGRMLWLFANGQDRSPVAPLGARPLVKSIGNSTTTPRDLRTEAEVKITLYTLCESVAERLREQDLRCRAVQITIRDNELFSYERQQMLEAPTCASREIFSAAYSLYQRHLPGRPVRSLGVRACRLLCREGVQLSLYPERVAAQKQEALESAVDQLRSRFGHFALQRGMMLTDRQLAALDPKAEHVIHPVGFLGAR